MAVTQSVKSPPQGAAWAALGAQADSVGLIEERGFLRFLEAYRGKADRFHEGARVFFGLMDQGGHCLAIQQRLRRFNGGLFRHVAALPITEDMASAASARAGRGWPATRASMMGCAPRWDCASLKAKGVTCRPSAET